MRRAFWFGLLAVLASCNRADDDDDTLVRQITRVRISPDDFLGQLSCGFEGGMQTYQATLVDVTEGLDEAFVLPSSRVISCKSDINFEFVEPGHRYIAHVSGFATNDVEAQHPGSTVVVDPEGRSVKPSWSTTCWGDDRIPGPAAGGAGGGPGNWGVEAYDRTIVRVRGCEAFEIAQDAGVSFDLTQAMFGLSCGRDEGEVFSYEIHSSSADRMDNESLGGLGGSQGNTPPLARALCADTATVMPLPPDLRLDFSVLAFEKDAQEPKWQTTCTTLTRPGVTIPARCNPLLER